MSNPQDPGTFDFWITNRLTFRTVVPKSGNTGDFEKWITDRIRFSDYVSASVTIIVGSTTWGHDTGVLETNVRDFTGNWTGTGAIENAGDAERLALETTEYMISEVVNTGAYTVTLLQNNYDPSGDDVDMDYRHGATEGACEVAGWNNYTVPFASLGYVQIRMTSTL